MTKEKLGFIWQSTRKILDKKKKGIQGKFRITKNSKHHCGIFYLTCLFCGDRQIMSS